MDQTAWSTTGFFPPSLSCYRLSGWELPRWIPLLYNTSCKAARICEDAHFYLWRWGPLAEHLGPDYYPLAAIIAFWQMFKAAGLHIKALSFVG